MGNIKGLRAEVKDVVMSHLSPSFNSDIEMEPEVAEQKIEDLTDDIIGEVNNYNRNILAKSTEAYLEKIRELRDNHINEVNALKNEIAELQATLDECVSGLKEKQIISSLESKLVKSQKIIVLLKEINEAQQNLIMEEEL